MDKGSVTSKKPWTFKLKSERPAFISLTAEALVETGPLRPGQSLPLTVRARTGKVDPIAWATAHRDLERGCDP